MSNVRKKPLRKAPLWATTINPHQPPYVESSEKAAPQSSALANHHQSPPTTLCRKFGKGRFAKLRSGQPPSIPTNHPMSNVRKKPLRKAPLWATTINPHQPPYVESSEKAAPQSSALVPHQPPPTTLCRKFGKVSLRYRFAPYHHRPHRHPEIAKGVCHKGLMSLSKGTVPKKAKSLNKLRPAIAGLRLPLGNLLF